MTRSALLVMAAVIAGCATAPAQAQRTHRTRVVVQSSGGQTQANSAWIGGSAAQTRVFVGADGETYVGVWVDAPNQVPGRVAQVRAPMALSLVVDTSGSMSGAKIQNARIAASSLLETLVDGDIVSIYAFNNGVMQIAPATQISVHTRAGLMQRVQMLNAAGGTNMWGGVTMGINTVANAPASHSVRRVVMISDGHANIGPSDPISLGNLAANGTEHAIQISAIGVGLDYDENTLGALAVRSSGRLYHLEHPHQMAAILEREVQLLANTIATNAVIEVIPAPGVTIVEPMTMGAVIQNNRLRVPVGSVYAGQQREILFRARVTTGQPGARQLATARLQYQTPDQQQQTQEVPLRYEVTRSQREAQRSTSSRVQAMVASYQVAQAQQRAAEALNRGDRAAADRNFQEAEEAIVHAEAAAPAMSQRDRSRLHRQQEQNRAVRSRARRATSMSAARAAALESNDFAMDAFGY